MKEFLYLSRPDVEKVGMSMREIIEIVEKAFIEKGNGRVQMPPKPEIEVREGEVFHGMLAYLPEMGALGVKWISGYRDNYKRGMPYVNGLIILNDPETGFPLAVMDCSWITAMRTGAATAVAAKYLARKNSETMGIIGCGVQGRTNLEAIKVVLPSIKTVYAYDVKPEVLDLYAKEMSEKFNVEVVKCSSPEEVVRNADVLVTAIPFVKNPTPFVEKEWLKEGVFICPLDFDTSLKGEVFKSMDKLYTDDFQQQRYYTSMGYFREVPEPQGDLGEVVTGKKPGRESDEEKTMSINLGLAIEDMSTALQIYKKAVEMGIGKKLNLY